MHIELTPTSPELRAAEARYQEDLASAEAHYAATLRSLGLTRRAAEVDERARSHRERAERIRRGGAR